MIAKIFHKYGKKKIFYGLATLFILIHLLFLYGENQKGISFRVDGKVFKYISDTDGVISYKDKEGTLLKLIIEDKKHPLPPDSMANKYYIEYEGKIIRVDYSDWLEGDAVITLSNGKEYKDEYLSMRHFQWGNLPQEVRMVIGIESSYEFAKTKPLSTIPFVGIIFILLGLASIIYTEEVWRFDHMFTVKGGEPTEWAIASSKFFGAIIIFIGIVMPFIG